MKKLFGYIVFLVIVLSQTVGVGQTVNASLTAKQFSYTDSNTLVDLYFKIYTDQLRVRAENDKEFIDVNLSYRFNPMDSNLNRYGKNLKVNFDMNELFDDHFLYKESLVINPGEYQLEVFLSDANSDFEDSHFSTLYKVDNKYENKISDVLLYNTALPAEKSHPFYKSGFAIYPKFQNGNYLFDKTDSVLNYYIEYYNIDSEDKVFIERYIRPKGRAGGLKSTYVVKELKNTQRKIESKSIDLSDIPSGNYILTYSIFTEKKERLSFKEVPFQRINIQQKISGAKIYKKDAIRELFKNTLIEKYELDNEHRLNQLIAAMALQEEKTERRNFYNAIDQPDLKLKQNFFISYWEEKNSFHPQTAIETFINMFESVQRKFAFRKTDGYKTEKGRVFLEYGKPDDIEKKSPDNRSAPYEIWHYYKLKSGQGNVIFVFKEENNSTDFRLIHSNAVGEIQNPMWKTINESLN